MRILAALAVFWLGSGLDDAAQGRRPARPPELDKLSFLVGAFAGELRVLAAPGAEPVRTPMNYRAAWELDSAWVMARYDQSPGGQSLRGILLYTWDSHSKRYLFYGLANAPMAPTPMRGTFQGTRLVFESDTTASFAYRETWEPAGRDTLITTLAYRKAGEWVVGSRAVLVRRAGSAP